MEKPNGSYYSIVGLLRNIIGIRAFRSLPNTCRFRAWGSGSKLEAARFNGLSVLGGWCWGLG